jgi:hypothetical protein
MKSRGRGNLNGSPDAARNRPVGMSQAQSFSQPAGGQFPFEPGGAPGLVYENAACHKANGSRAAILPSLWLVGRGEDKASLRPTPGRSGREQPAPPGSPDMKLCRRCAQEKPLEGFYKSAINPDGRCSICRPCHLAYSKALVEAKRRGGPRPYYTLPHLRPPRQKASPADRVIELTAQQLQRWKKMAPRANPVTRRLGIYDLWRSYVAVVNQ